MSRSDRQTELSHAGSNAGSVCAVIVTWQPELPPLQILFESLLKQNCPVIVVDNGSANNAELRAVIDALAERYAHVAAPVLVSWDHNKGLATAMNEGLRQARRDGKAFVLLFDQDSQIGPDFVIAMLAQWQQLESPDKPRLNSPTAAMGPRLQDPVTGRRTAFRCFRWLRRSDCKVEGFPGVYETDFLISSGTLISMAALNVIGGMKDEYFIDNIDLEWCFRAKARGYSLYGTDSALLFHRIGEDSRNPLVTTGIMVQHSPLRSYYSTRNRMHLWRQPYAPRDWKIRDKVRFVLKSLWLVCFTANRKEYREQIRRGMRDAETLL